MQYVFIVKKNSDTIEGRGPMVIDSIWAEDAEDAAIEYMNSQPGIMGRREKWSEKQYGDWIIEKTAVLTSEAEFAEVKREQARKRGLNKLSREEREALGV